MASKIGTICNENIVPLINSLGYDVIEVDYSKKIDGMNLTFTISKPEGITIADCERVHKMVDKKLDQINPTDDVPFTLNVQSEGLDRPIKTHTDFLRHQGEDYQIKLYAPLNDKKTYEGKLVNYTDTHVEIESAGVMLSFEKAKVALIVPVLKF
jgi:ribosome maturation factor RimP